jgi:hypoxanthine phosphoribosyltransferase
MNKMYIEWHQFHLMIDALADKIKQSDWKPDYIVGLTRGGLIPATILSHRLKAPLETLKVSLRDGGQPEHNFWMATDAYDKKKILIVDDLNDSGNTINWIMRDWMDSCHMEDPVWDDVWGHSVRVAVLFNSNDSAAKLTPSYYIHDLKEPKPWIVFPWENE